MILRRDMLLAVERGKKTEHRLPLAPDPHGEVRPPVHREQTVPLMRRWGMAPEAHAFVVDVRIEPVVAITYESALAEGHRTRADFAHRWMRRFALYRDHHRPEDDGELLALFTEWHQRDQAWVIVLKPIEGPRLLVPTGRAGEDGTGYSSNELDALPDEPEVIDQSRLHVDWDQRASIHQAAAGAAVDADRLSGLTHPDERLGELLRMALERGVDVSSDARVIRARMAAIERKVSRAQLPQAA